MAWREGDLGGGADRAERGHPHQTATVRVVDVQPGASGRSRQSDGKGEVLVGPIEHGLARGEADGGGTEVGVRAGADVDGEPARLPAVRVAATGHGQAVPTGE